jgi:nicotinamidase-related amidase
MPATALDPKTALVVIDLQKGLAAYPTIHPMAGLIANTARLADAFRAKKLPVILVTVAISPDGADAVRTRTETPMRFLPTAPDFAELVPELAARPGDILITKRQPNAFFGTELDLQLRRRGVTGILLTGVSTSSGVDGTARAAFERSYNISFVSDAISDMDAATHEHVMKKVFPRHGEIDTADAFLALLRG